MEPLNGRAHTRTQHSQLSMETSFYWVSLAHSSLYNYDGKQSGPGVSALSLTGTVEDWLSGKHVILAKEMTKIITMNQSARTKSLAGGRHRCWPPGVCKSSAGSSENSEEKAPSQQVEHKDSSSSRKVYTSCQTFFLFCNQTEPNSYIQNILSSAAQRKLLPLPMAHTTLECPQWH